jgi:hypothetical protein
MHQAFGLPSPLRAGLPGCYDWNLLKKVIIFKSSQREAALEKWIV